ncbi:MAG: NADH:ubiquinone reductase (Na(+)-transporting) subunit C [Rikenellaceae bacterium]
MNRNSNTYTIIYATVLVVVVAAVLSFAAVMLSEPQAANVLIEKKGAILSSIGQGQDASSAANKESYVNEEFSKYITKTFFVDAQGKVTEADEKSLLDALGNLPEIFAKGDALPVFESNEGTYIVPITGKGLWGAIWGYIAIASDGNTILGATFDHKSETPGLGAEIATEDFSREFKDKKLFENGEFVSIDLVKGGGASTSHEVDAVSGGTLTSNGVRDMLKSCLGQYAPFFKLLQN